MKTIHEVDRTEELESETGPGVSRRRFRLVGFGKSSEHTKGEDVAFLELADDDPSVMQDWKLDSAFLPLRPSEYFAISDHGDACREKGEAAERNRVTLDDRDYPPLPVSIEYEITVRRLTP